MQEKPNSVSTVLGALTRQPLLTSPGGPPAAVITKSLVLALSWDVGVPEVSARQEMRDARADHDAIRKQQRIGV